MPQSDDPANSESIETSPPSDESASDKDPSPYPNAPTADAPPSDTSSSREESEAANEALETQPAPTICLDQFLKTCGVETGGQAKRLIQGGEVLLNGDVETRRRKKLRHGDEVQLFDEIYVVAFEDEIDP